MDSNVTLSWLAVFAIFLSGVALGWAVARTHIGGSLKAGISTAGLSQGAKPGGFGFVRQTTVRSLALKCQCGAVWKFAEGTDPQPPGTQPIPTGDSFVCPKCGNSMYLKAERQLEAEALAKLDLKKDV